MPEDEAEKQRRATAFRKRLQDILEQNPGRLLTVEEITALMGGRIPDDVPAFNEALERLARTDFPLRALKENGTDVFMLRTATVPLTPK